jgi:hypothetical protein
LIVTDLFEGTSCLALQPSALAPQSSALSMEAGGSSETLIMFSQSARRHVPEDSNFRVSRPFVYSATPPSRYDHVASAEGMTPAVAFMNGSRYMPDNAPKYRTIDFREGS